ncbi:hypothetical protein TNIN_127391 [Trichonephila inaurata madagascariensis]|uniref:Uncharacterized protein n=1 Tax=Trichonephila inaurata madagascariensis TaxID=2747483 RepID=A0A8X6IYE9_9ARAC|nr:hypothetical protein TNIN_127391 [Trichonephila inaurata madagascariensis]
MAMSQPVPFLSCVLTNVAAEGNLSGLLTSFFFRLTGVEKLILASSTISSFLTSCLRKFINNFKIRPSPGVSSLKFLLLSNANNMSSGRQDSKTRHTCPVSALGSPELESSHPVRHIMLGDLS